MSSTAPTVADTIARVIAVRGADRVFVFPGGGSNLELIDSLEQRGVAVVLTRSEGGAALMAASYADLVGRPAVVLVGLGPGAASVVNGLAHARLDQSAVLVITDRLPEADLARTGHQVLDQVALLGPVTKWQATLTAEGAADAVERALSVAGAPPRGPVHLELPADVAPAPATGRAPAGAPAPTSATGGMARDPTPGGLAEAAALLSGARRPVVLVGDESPAAPQRPLVTLLERIGAPVLCSPKAKGTVPEDHPLWCGIVTNAALEAPLLEGADAILALGLDPVELLSRPWPAGAPVIALREHDEPSAGYRPRHLFVGEMGSLVQALHGSLGVPAGAWSRSEIESLRAEMLSAVRVESTDSLSALDVVEEVLAQVPEPCTVTVDAGAHMFAAIWGWRSTRPRRFLISNGLATMGYAVPAAIAAALARPQEPVVAFTGDGGFLLHAAELETAVRARAHVVVVVINDSGLGLIRIKQQERGYRRAAVDFETIDAAGVARSLGAAGFVATTRDDVRVNLAGALAQPRPAVLDVRVSGSEYGELQRVLRSTGAGRGAGAPAEALCRS
jgi:acetolactate synthase-1/2/3 large subunit